MAREIWVVESQGWEMEGKWGTFKAFLSKHGAEAMIERFTHPEYFRVVRYVPEDGDSEGKGLR